MNAVVPTAAFLFALLSALDAGPAAGGSPGGRSDMLRGMAGGKAEPGRTGQDRRADAPIFRRFSSITASVPGKARADSARCESQEHYFRRSPYDLVESTIIGT